MKKNVLTLAYIAFGINALATGYDDGFSAISKDSSIIKSWATGIEIHRGLVDIADPTAMDNDTNAASFGHASNALGNASGNSTDVVSLGDGGWATLTFSKPIVNGNGPDFAVFENGFEWEGATFGELAFVEVSSDGINFTRFPSHSLIQDTLQLGGFEGFDPKEVNNLAGKDIAGYGTPFDLDELKNSPNLDVNNIRFVKLIDVIGTIDSQYASLDTAGNIINNPYSTPYASSGFDLDGIGVINQKEEPNEIINLADVTLGENGVFNGTSEDGDSSFESGLLSFNYSNTGFWNGFAASNHQDDTTAGWANDKSAITASGIDSIGDTYGICNGSDKTAFFTNGGAHKVNGMYFTNSTYATRSMQQGDSFAKKFGGESGNDKDFFLLKIWGTQLNGEATEDTVNFYLADFRFDDNSEDYIVTNWRYVDLTSLGAVTELNFALSSSDNGDWGMNTPAYFAFDNINITKDFSPTSNLSIPDVTASQEAIDTVIDLTGWYSDADNDDALIEYSIKSSDSSLFSAEITNNELSITFNDSLSGTADLIVEIKSNGQTILDTISIEVSNGNSLEEIVANAKLYPNPAIDNFVIEGIQNGVAVDVIIYSSNGQVVLTQNNYLNNTRMDVSSLAPGIYQVKIGSSTQKLIIK